MDNIYISFFIRKYISDRVKILFFSPIIFFAFFLSLSPSFASEKEITPERDISVVRYAPQSPDWKILWDGARNLVRGGQYELAADVYGQLFSIKPNIEEANWEYSKVLLQTKDYKTASKIIALLLEKNSTKNEYLLVAGQVARQQGKYAEAERFFGLIFEKSPTGKYGDAALEGLAFSLRSRGQKELAFPLMQQLNIRKPDDKIILHDFAVDATDLKRFSLARNLYRKLLTDENINETVIFEAESLFSEDGFEKEHTAVLERYLKIHPEYLPFRMKLMARNEENGEFDELMEHLAFLIENSDQKKQFLLKAIDVSKNVLKRPDLALVYLERIRQLQPGDLETIEAIEELQEQLATDFLSIVENGGAELLWTDLVSMGVNRQVIFRRMVTLLEKKKKYLLSIDVLEILYQHGDKSNTVILKLAQLNHALKKYDDSKRYVDLLPNVLRDSKYYRLKASNESHLGLEIDSFTTLTKALEFKPEDVNLRQKCIKLAGQLGLVEEQLKLFNYLKWNAANPLSVDITTLHVQQLAQNHFFNEAILVCDKALKLNGDDSSLIQLYLLKSTVLRDSGRLRSAEQLLRQLLNEKRYQSTAILQLFENAITDNDSQMARKWWGLIDGKPTQPHSSTVENENVYKKHIAHIRLLGIEGDTDGALELVDQALNESSRKMGGAKHNEFIKDLLIEKCRLYLAAGDYLKAGKVLKEKLIQGEFDVDVFVLTEMATHSGDSFHLENVFEQKLRRADTILFTRVLELVEKELQRGQISRAKDHYSLIEDTLEGSVRLKNARTKLALLEGNIDLARQDLLALQISYPSEKSFCKRQIDIFAQSGHYEDALKKYDICFPQGMAGNSTLSEKPARIIEDKILYSRLLWGDKQYEASLAEYKKLLDPPIHQQLINQFKEKRIDYQYLTRQQSFWNSMMLLMESDPEIIAELMEPVFLFDHLGDETGIIVSNNFEQYSWQKIIENEFLARKATFNKNYHFAAKSYEKLLAEEESTESKVDLATIYGRIGKFRKEAQVYEEISNVGLVRPELQESITRNFLQIRPTNTVDAMLEERSGRGETVDIRKTALGSTFWFTPDLNKDFWLSYSYNQYESTERKGELDSNLIRGAMTYEFSGNYEFITGIGAEKFSDNSDNEMRYNFELRGQLDDYVSGFVLFEKAPIDDTVTSIEDGIYRQFIQTGLTVETELGVTFGGDLRYSLYNDDNEQNRFYWFSSYSIFGETLQLDLRYAYQYLSNKDINAPESGFTDDINDDFVTDYWSPEKYSEHRVGLQLKKDFFGSLTDVENKMSYFRFDTGLSLEDEENIVYSARFDIFLEMSPHLLLKGNFSFNSSDVYDEKMLSLSLHYSW